ncbi:efflux RND transporter periplasmic adaptor subunit [Salimicrobium halophilum]|uniref:HlyD family secretion protein n=1 Tax=Salimicrobium halophilum TaxID=86666 RepID=A0A1G8VSB0_9BACI|nr:efflux RND transporter periplasmic adaptor subunit [Salimicrobium halophilum]SDJ68295.1 HlyD family secretion protein [Salimicrobium halophilum]
MTKKQRVIRRIVGVSIILFITLNGLLVYFDQKNRVTQKSYIEEWSQSFTGDIFERLETEGVFASSDKNNVYFDHDRGSFREFLVEEGDAVNEGDDLYTYKVLNYASREAELESEIDRLEEDVDALEEYIDEIEDYDIPEPDTDIEDEDYDHPTPSSYVEAEFEQEEKVAEKEMELAQKEAELAMVEDQLDQLEDEGETITVTSAFDGTVTDISESLEDPVLTLQSTELLLRGNLSEEERKQVEEEMTTIAEIPEDDIVVSGEISTLHEFPEETNLHLTSSYPFEADVTTDDEEILPGYHAEVDIITDESIDTTIALDKALISDENLYAWVMNEEGLLERRSIATALKEKNLIEVTEGLESGEWLAVEEEDEFRNNAPFLTPLDTENLDVSRLFALESETMITYGLLGLISR